MKLSRIFAAACTVCVLSGFTVAAPAGNQGAVSDRSALVDEAPAPAAIAGAATSVNGAANGTAANTAATAGDAEKKSAEEATKAETRTAKAACDSTAASNDSGSDFPVASVVISSIATIAFVILAIIF